ncbi:MAG: hypothetical protein EA374_03460 [Acholeplasmatales bacterium]|nr:MAG: hypothetical protein EA374_03460 [Acholeplasmatales bacterium]
MTHATTRCEMDQDLLADIQRTAYAYLMDHTQFDETRPAYGLTADHSAWQDVASIAATGFTLSAFIIGVEYDYISRLEATHKVKGILRTLLNTCDHYHGFFAHFFDIPSGKRYQQCEYSTIDTALALNGVLAVDAYFKDPQISRLSKALFDRVDWSILMHEYHGRKTLYMSYNPDKFGDYAEGKAGFIHRWDMFAEQLMMYLFIGGSKQYSAYAYDLYKGFERTEGHYQGHTYYYSPGNALFVYQFPLAWLDAEAYQDDAGINWFKNAESASRAHRAVCMRNQHTYKTFSADFWGLTASDSPGGYHVFGALPRVDNQLHTDGTIAPSAAVGSLPFTPALSLQSIQAMKAIPDLWGRYGFKDAFNFEGLTPWISDKYYSINKGLEMLMVNAALSKDVQKAYMCHPIIQKGLRMLKWKKTAGFERAQQGE